jgi:hypothetical protein
VDDRTDTEARVTIAPAVETPSILVEDRLGAFASLRQTALAGDDTGQSNVAAVVAALQKEVVALRRQNELMTTQLANASSPTSPTDFAAAVQRSIDKLQSQLATMTNAVTSFAVREFKLETHVQLEVTAFGDITYRFPSPTSKPDPGTLSRISLDLVPVPKQTTAGTFKPGMFKPETSIADIAGLAADQQVALHRHQIDTVGDFLAVATRARSSIELAGLLKADRQQLAGWVANAELLTIEGIDGPRAAVLVEAGIHGLAGMAAVGVDRLVKQFKAALSKTEHRDARPVGPTEAAHWIQAAKAYLGQAAPAAAKSQK